MTDLFIGAVEQSYHYVIMVNVVNYLTSLVPRSDSFPFPQDASNFHDKTNRNNKILLSLLINTNKTNTHGI